MADIIDPLEAILVVFQQDADMAALTGGRIAGKHRFAVAGARTPGGTPAWTTPSKALTIGYDTGGTPDTQLPNQYLRLRLTCWGEDEEQAAKVYRKAVQVSRAAERVVVTTSAGNALVYWIAMDGTPLTGRDPDVQVDVIVVPVKVNVAETPVP